MSDFSASPCPAFAPIAAGTRVGKAPTLFQFTLCDIERSPLRRTEAAPACAAVRCRPPCPKLMQTEQRAMNGWASHAPPFAGDRPRRQITSEPARPCAPRPNMSNAARPQFPPTPATHGARPLWRWRCARPDAMRARPMRAPPLLTDRSNDWISNWRQPPPPIRVPGCAPHGTWSRNEALVGRLELCPGLPPNAAPPHGQLCSSDRPCCPPKKHRRPDPGVSVPKANDDGMAIPQAVQSASRPSPCPPPPRLNTGWKSPRSFMARLVLSPARAP